jgi:hypothetical protein
MKKLILLSLMMVTCNVYAKTDVICRYDDGVGAPENGACWCSPDGTVKCTKSLYTALHLGQSCFKDKYVKCENGSIISNNTSSCTTAKDSNDVITSITCNCPTSNNCPS